MIQKIADSNSNVSKGGRLRRYWDEHGIKQKRSAFTEYSDTIDISGILKEYHVKGFEFGRYVNNEDRYDFVLAAKASLKDLSWLLKSKNIGMDNNVGIAFGARGMGGGAIAHYEPYLNMINLTKLKGAQSLAHELGHAIDYNIGRFIDQNKNYGALSGGRSTAAYLDDNTGGACRLLTRNLINEIKNTDSFKRLAKASAYWHYNTEVFARFFEQWCCYKLTVAKKQNVFLCKDWKTYTIAKQYLSVSDFKKVLPLGDRLMKNIGLLLNGKPTEKILNTPVLKKKKTTKKPPVKKAASK